MTQASLSKTTAEGFCSFDCDWRFTFVSSALAEFMGGSAANWIGRPLADWSGPALAEKIASSMSVDDGRREFMLSGLDSSVLQHGRLEIAPTLGPGGRLAGYEGWWWGPRQRLAALQQYAHGSAIDDLLERLSHPFIRAAPDQLETAIRDSLEELGRFVEASSSFLFEFDTIMDSVSKRYEWHAMHVRSTLSDFAQVDAEKMRTLFPRAAAGEVLRIDDLEQLGEHAVEEKKQLASLSIGAFLVVPVRIGQRVAGLLGFDRHGGGRVWTDDEQRLLQVASGIFAQALDRLQSQDRLAFHFNTTPLAVIEWDHLMRVRRWSPSAERIFGWSAEEVLGRGVTNWPFIYESDIPAVKAIAGRLIDGRSNSEVHVNRNYTASGELLTCEWFNSVHRDPAGRLVSILSFAQDITEAQRTQKQLAQSRDELRRLHSELRVRASDALRESEVRYGLLADLATDLVGCHSLEGVWLWASQASEALLGFRPDELIGRQPFSMFHPDDVGRIRTGHDQMLSSGRPWTVTYRLRHKRGHYVWVETASRIARIDQTHGESQQIVSVTRDASARQQAELALRDSESRYRQLAEYATDLITRHDDQGRFTYLSPACVRILGYEPEELIGCRPRIIAHEEDRQHVIESLGRLRASTEMVRLTFRAVRKDGAVRWLEASSRNEGQEIVVVSRDVTERLEAEQQLRLIRLAIEQVREAVLITENREGPRWMDVVYFNPGLMAMTGYTAEEIREDPERLLRGPKTDSRQIQKLRDAQRRGDSWSDEVLLYRKDGSSFVAAINLTPIIDAQSKITHWVVIQRDMTARRTADEMARLHLEELAHASRLTAMGEMASGLAHELNQPLAAVSNYVQGSLQMLSNGAAENGKLADALKKASSQAERAGRIVRSIRDFVSNRPRPRSRRALGEIVDDTLALAASDIQRYAARVEVEQPGSALPVRVEAIQIEQVLLNLIRNALESMEEKPVSDRLIQLVLGRTESGEVQLSIRDRGRGMTADQLDWLFHPFFTTKEDGMGMGLTISHSIVQAHGGRLWAEAPKGGGTIFRMVLPADETDRKA